MNRSRNTAHAGKTHHRDCRAAAAVCLAAVANGQSLSQQLPSQEASVAERDRPLLRQLCYGTLRLYPKLSAIASQLLNKPLKAKDQDIFMLILLGGYQLTETRIPDHAALSATVNAAVKLKKTWAKALVNAVLRQWQRQQADLISPLTRAEQAAHPDWLFTAIHSAWPDQADSIIHANNSHPPMCLRVNQRKSSRDHYLLQLNEAGINASRCAFASEGLRLETPIAVNELPGFDQGEVSVQDEAPQLSAQLLNLEPGQRVLDACCAPGGKTCHILETEPKLATVWALDIDQQRLEKVAQNMSRLDLNAQLHCGDAAQPQQWWDKQPFDRILVDAPCSATGVIRRNPDIKLHRKQQDIKQLAEQQLALLHALWPTLKPDGLMLYATCSILPEENEKVVEQFCHSTADAKHQPIHASWGQARSFGRQLLPEPVGHDGFFYALIKKIP